VYEFSNHLGNVLTTFSDRKIATEGTPGYVTYYTAEILSSTDYYPFGFQMPGRSYTGGGYRYGFNSMEKDDELKGSGNSYDFGARIYDPRVGRWLAVDPLRNLYPAISPYSAFLNLPLLIKDKDGKILTDSEGNPIYIKGPVVELVPPGGTLQWNPQTNQFEVFVIKVQILIYFDNSGAPIYVQDRKNGSYGVISYEPMYDEGRMATDENGNFIKNENSKSFTEIHKYENDELWDCHGYTFFKRKFNNIKIWLTSYHYDEDESDNISPILNNDGWVLITSSISDALPGDLAVFTDTEGITHTCFYNGNNTFASKNTADPFDSQSDFEYLVNRYSNGNQSNVSFYRGGSDRKVVDFDGSGKKTENGRKIKSMRKVQRTLSQSDQNSKDNNNSTTNESKKEKTI